MKYPLGLPYTIISSLSAKTLKKSWKKRDTYTKNLKNPKFRAKAKLKDYKSVLYWYYLVKTKKSGEHIAGKVD